MRACVCVLVGGVCVRKSKEFSALNSGYDDSVSTIACAVLLKETVDDLSEFRMSDKVECVLYII